MIEYFFIYFLCDIIFNLIFYFSLPSQNKTNGKPASPEPIRNMMQYKGWLSEKKAGTALHLSSKRWCVLDGHQLLIYDSKEETNPIKSLNLPQFQVRMIVGDMDCDDDDETDPKVCQEEYILELRLRRASSGKSDVYLFAAETEKEFNQWGKLLSLGATKRRRSGNTYDSKYHTMQSRSSLSPDDVFIEVPSFDQKSKPNCPNHQSEASLSEISVDVKLSSHGQKRDLARTISAPFSPYTKEKAESDFNDILRRADFTFWEEEQPSIGTKHRKSADMLESCLLAASTKKSPRTSPTGSPSVPRRADVRYTSLPANTKIQTPPSQRSKRWNHQKCRQRAAHLYGRKLVKDWELVGIVIPGEAWDHQSRAHIWIGSRWVLAQSCRKWILMIVMGCLSPGVLGDTKQEEN